MDQLFKYIDISCQMGTLNKKHCATLIFYLAGSPGGGHVEGNTFCDDRGLVSTSLNREAEHSNIHTGGSACKAAGGTMRGSVMFCNILANNKSVQV